MAVDIDYARNGELSIAYTVIGDVDVVFGAGLMSHLDLIWGDPNAFAWFQRLAAVSRVILFDKPGTGLSDPVPGPPTLEQRAGDFLAVMDAVGSARAVVIGLSEAGPPAAVVAAMHAERVEGLVLLSSFARPTTAPDYLPEMEEAWERDVWPHIWRATEKWGDGEFLRWLSPWFRRNPVYSRLAPSVERACASPAMTRSIIHGMRAYDARSALEQVRAPTLVVGRSEEIIPIESIRDMAERVAGARLRELPGDEHLCFFEGDDIADAILDFLDAPASSGRRQNRALLSVVYTDIVGSTSEATRLGDERWRSVLARHDDVTTEETEKHGGRVVKTLGDGALLVFDQPAAGVRAAVAIRDRVAELGVTIRAAAHTGECDVMGGDIAGIAAHVGSRLLGHADPGEVIVSGTIRDLTLGSGLELESKGAVELRDLPGRWEILVVTGAFRAAEARRRPVGPDDMRRVDRSMVAVAQRAPRLSRTVMRAASRLGRSRG